MPETIQFDPSKAARYRKRVAVMAFQSKDALTFDKTQSWGSEQEIRGGGWIIIPLEEDGSPSTDIYGCDGDAFDATYSAAPELGLWTYRKLATVEAYQPGAAFQVSTVVGEDSADGAHTETKLALGGAKDWLVRNPGGELYVIEASAFPGLYESADQEPDEDVDEDPDETNPGLDEPTRGPDRPPAPAPAHVVARFANDGRPKRILSLDGGGVRGILTLGFLRAMETALRERHNNDAYRLCDYFDLIAGTSTGAILAAGLATGMETAELTGIYRSLAPKIFPPFHRRGLRLPAASAMYSSEPVERELQQAFRTADSRPFLLGGPELLTGLMVVTKRHDTGSTWPITNNPSDRYYNTPPGSTAIANRTFPLWKVVRASTAAPLYFPPQKIVVARNAGGGSVQGEFVDGGVSPNNNPSLAALQLVSLGGFGVDWPLDPEKLHLVSIGTGRAPSGKKKRQLAGMHALDCLVGLMGECSHHVETLMQWLSDGPTARRLDRAIGDLSGDLLAGRPLLSYVRFDVEFSAEELLDLLGEAVSDEHCEELAEMANSSLDNLDLLHALGDAAARRQFDAEAHLPRGRSAEGC